MAASTLPTHVPTVRSRILAATARLVIERGDNFTIQDVIKESGVALQTFYRSFNGKDDLLLAVIAEMISDACQQFSAAAAEITDPLLRLRSHITSVVVLLQQATDGGASARFIANQRTRLAGLYPGPTALAEQPFVQLVQTELMAACQSGQIHTVAPERDAYFITQLVLSVFRHDAFASVYDLTLADDVWRFCLHGVLAANMTLDGNGV